MNEKNKLSFYNAQNKEKGSTSWFNTEKSTVVTVEAQKRMYTLNNSPAVVQVSKWSSFHPIIPHAQLKTEKAAHFFYTQRTYGMTFPVCNIYKRIVCMVVYCQLWVHTLLFFEYLIRIKYIVTDKRTFSCFSLTK